MASLAAGKAKRPEVKRERGRPARTEEVARLVVLLPPDLKDTLGLQARAEDRDMSTIVAEALKVYLGKNADTLRAYLARVTGA